MPTTRIAVIGGVAAGPAAAAQAKRIAPDADVILFDQGPHISYGACEIPYYVAGDIADLDALIQHTPASLDQSRGVRVYVQHRVTALHPRRNRIEVVRLTDGEHTTQRFDKVILAIGARGRRLDVPGADAANVVQVRTLEDAAYLKQHLDAQSVRHTVILGGGFVGVEMAEALRARGVRVTVLAPEGRLFAGTLAPTITKPLHAAMEQHGVIVRADRAVALYQQENGRVAYVQTERGERVGCDLVLNATGLVPNTALAEDAGIRLGATGGIRVDAHMRTNVPNVWACGDCIEVIRRIDQQPVLWPFATTAYQTAQVAGTNAARRGHGTPARFAGIVGSMAVQAFGLEVAKVGLTLAEAQAAGFDARSVDVEHWSRVSFYPGAKRIRLRLIAERARGRLLGAQGVGAEGVALRINTLVPILQASGTVQDVHDLELIYTPPLAPLHDPLRVAASQLRKQLQR